jgi:hypothetical protein
MFYGSCFGLVSGFSFVSQPFWFGGWPGGRNIFPWEKATRFAQTSFSWRENIPSPRPSNHCGIGNKNKLKTLQ